MIKIDKKKKIPLYIQVKTEIMDLINKGQLKVGDKMPTERELSENLGISRNTISTAYSYLENEGVLKSYQGKGTFVAEDAKPWKADSVKDRIIKFVDLAFEEAIEFGLNADEFIQIVSNTVKKKEETMKRINGIYVECNIEQARMFSKQLERNININAEALTIQDLKECSLEVRKKIENSEVIVTTFNHVSEVKELLLSFNKVVYGVAINADLETIVKIARYPKETKFGLICISDEFMFKIKRSLEKAGLSELNIKYSNSLDNKEILSIINNSDIIMVSPGRFNKVKELNNDKEILEFLFSLDEDSVNVLKSKLVGLKSEDI